MVGATRGVRQHVVAHARATAQDVRAAVAARIAGGGLRPGDRLPAERDVLAEFDVARSVIRQALAGRARDGMIVSDYPRGDDAPHPPG